MTVAVRNLVKMLFVAPLVLCAALPAHAQYQSNQQGQSSAPYQPNQQGQSSAPYQPNQQGQSSAPYQQNQQGQSSAPYQPNQQGQSSAPYQPNQQGQSSAPYQQNQQGQSSAPYQPNQQGQSSAPYQPNQQGQSSAPYQPNQQGQSSAPYQPNQQGQSSAPYQPNQQGQSSAPYQPNQQGQSSAPYQPNQQGQSSAPYQPNQQGQSSAPYQPNQQGQSNAPNPTNQQGQASAPNPPTQQGQVSAPNPTNQQVQSSPINPTNQLSQTGDQIRPVVQKLAPLPTLPPTPLMGNEVYPSCREKYQTVDSPYDKTDSLNRCTILIDLYYLEVLNPYRERMIVHQNEISAIYVDKVSGRATFAGKRHDNFYAKMMQEHADSNPDGAHQAAYRKAEQGYQNDRAYMLDRYCFNAGCNGYPVPEYDYVAAQERADEKAGISKKKKKKKKKPRSRKKCKAARAGGGLLGGLLGGALGKAVGLGKVGTLIAGGLGAILGSELACKLSEKEQEVAADATVKVIEKEQVGATVAWKSPERKGVSGSSTVTALNTEPNGATCLNITDVAIIDGEETRISKRMCRGKGKSRYTVMA